MIIKILSSSSSGNCTLIEKNNELIMIDAGISYKKINEGYQGINKLSHLFITHEHSDHIKGAGIVGRKTECQIFIPEQSYNEIIQKKDNFFENCNINYIEGGNEIDLTYLKIKAFSTKHDSAASLGYIITDKETNKKFAFLTDTGVITPLIRENLKGCDAYFLECDYDLETLEKYEEYDELLKERIKSPIGHLSNQEAIKYIKEELDLDKIQFIILGHLSKNTNSPELLLSQLKENFDEKFLSKFYIAQTQINLELK